MSRPICSITALLLSSILGGAFLGSLVHAQETPADLIRELSSERHSTRVAAEKKLWKLGDAVSEELEKVVTSGNPEAALRASKLLRYIQWGMTPDTPEEIIKLAERFPQLTEDQKNDAYQSLIKLREYRLALLLYRNEKNPQAKAATRDAVQGLAILSARASILAGKPADARKTLEDFRDDAQNSVALAWLARAEGNLEKEIARTSHLLGKENLDYRLALLRIQGNRQAIADFAERHYFTNLHDSMELLEGRPEAWIRWYTENVSTEHRDLNSAYSKIVMARLKNPNADVSDTLAILSKAAMKKDDSSRRWSAITVLNALGETQMVAKAVNLINPSVLFSLYVETEKIDEALKVAGLDPLNPDYHAWIEKEMETMIQGDSDFGMESIPLMLSFLERRGLMEPIKEVFVPKMIELAKKDEDSFLELLSGCFASAFNSSLAAESAILVANEYAKDDPVLWGNMVVQAFGLANTPNPTFQKWYDLLAELYPEEHNTEVFRRTLQLFRKLPIPQNELNDMNELIEQFFKKAKKQDLEANRRLIRLLYTNTSELRYISWLDNENQTSDANELMRQERWKDAATVWLEQTKLHPEDVDCHTWAAACFRKAGMMDEAKKHEQMMDLLILGDTRIIYLNSTIYQRVGLTELAEQWRNTYLNCSGVDRAWIVNLFQQADLFFLEGKYQQAHAYYEAYLLTVITDQNTNTFTISHRYQNKARMAQAFSLLSKDRKLALTILKSCHQNMKADASLADEFFPNLRKAGLTQEHDAWFEESWQSMMTLVKRFPKDDNIRNSAAWLAARSMRRLDEAEQQSSIALELRPRQSTYLDTMAEVWFARGNRKKAVEWSRKAIDSDPSQDTLLDQYFRFQSGDFPQ